MTEYSQSRIYSSLWSGQRTHCHDLSDPPFPTQLSWAILWGAYVSCPRSFSCHPSATKAGQSPAACWGSGMWVVLAGSQALCAGAMLSVQDHSLPPHVSSPCQSTAPPCSVWPCGSCHAGSDAAGPCSDQDSCSSPHGSPRSCPGPLAWCRSVRRSLQ